MVKALATDKEFLFEFLRVLQYSAFMVPQLYFLNQSLKEFLNFGYLW